MADQQEENSEEKMDLSYVEERYSFARKEQWVQKAFLVGMLSFLSLGVLGLFGSGYLSERNISGRSFDIEYQRFLREDTTTDMYINLKDADDTTVVSIPNNYIKQVKIEQIIPEPESVEMRNNRLYYEFITANTGIIALYLRPEWSGTKELEIGVQGEVVTLQQFVYF